MVKTSSPQRWKLTLAYDGTDFEGWQSQPNQSAVQDILQARMAVVLREDVKVVGASRTDSGVHADAQVCHFDHPWPHGPVRLRKALQADLPPSLVIRAVQRVRADFHARYDAKGKRYVYRAYHGVPMPRDARYRVGIKDPTLDLAATREAAQLFLGKHDFTAFSGRDHSRPDRDPYKTITRCEVRVHGKRLDFLIEGDSFLYKMCRSLAGVLINVAIGRVQPGDIPAMLETGNRTARIPTAPAKGLCLERVFY